MDCEALCKARFSLRKFSDRPVEKEKLQKILEAGRNAPTACNLQPQRIFVMQSNEALQKVDRCAGCHFNPPVMLVVAWDPNVAWTRKEDGRTYGEVDAALAISQMMLQAADLGLGTTYVGMFEPENLIREFPQMEGLIPIALLPLGYAAEDAHPAHLHEKRQPLEEMVTWL